jgi:glycosyltransferase involved in cell wall biosynthesis
MRLAKSVQSPEKIILWTNEASKLDKALLKTVSDIGAEIKEVALPDFLESEVSKRPQHAADWLRLKILHDQGGIYLDTDLLLMRDLNDLLDFSGRSKSMVLSWEGENKDSSSNSIMISPRGGVFCAEWLAKTSEMYMAEEPSWAYCGVLLPAKLVEKENLQHHVLVFDYTFACALHFSRPWLFEKSLYEEAERKTSESRAIHVFETYHWPTIAKIDNNWVDNNECLLSEIVKRGRKIVENRKLKICVYAISKNEEKFVERFCEAAKEADLVFIADTGSTDGTVESARACGAMVNSIHISPWRFDHARNAALALVPGDIDICVSLDLDEILQPGWREEIERVWKDDTTRLRYMFDWGCGIAFKYEKIHARKGYYWHHPCHEYPVPDGRTKEVWADTDMLLVVHKPDPTKSRGQYMDLLELSVKEDPDCPRNAFYYARELSFHRRWKESIVACESYLKLPRATWQNERCYAYRVMGRCYSELGDLWNAEKSFRLAAIEAPNTREPWCELALLMYRQSKWLDCFSAAMKALQIKDRLLVYTVDPEVWGHQPHDLAAISAYWLGLQDIALEQARICVKMSPDDARLKANLALIEKQSNKQLQEVA